MFKEGSNYRWTVIDYFPESGEITFQTEWTLSLSSTSDAAGLDLIKFSALLLCIENVKLLRRVRGRSYEYISRNEKKTVIESRGNSTCLPPTSMPPLWQSLLWQSQTVPDTKPVPPQGNFILKGRQTHRGFTVRRLIVRCLSKHFLKKRKKSSEMRRKGFSSSDRPSTNRLEMTRVVRKSSGVCGRRMSSEISHKRAARCRSLNCDGYAPPN